MGGERVGCGRRGRDAVRHINPSCLVQEGGFVRSLIERPVLSSSRGQSCRVQSCSSRACPAVKSTRLLKCSSYQCCACRRALVDMESALQSIEECKAVGTDPTMHELKVGTIVDEIKCAARDSLVYSNALGPVQVRLSTRTPHDHVTSSRSLTSVVSWTHSGCRRTFDLSSCNSTTRRCRCGQTAP